MRLVDFLSSKTCCQKLQYKILLIVDCAIVLLLEQTSILTMWSLFSLGWSTHIRGISINDMNNFWTKTFRPSSISWLVTILNMMLTFVEPTSSINILFGWPLYVVATKRFHLRSYLPYKEIATCQHFWYAKILEYVQSEESLCNKNHFLYTINQNIIPQYFQNKKVKFLPIYSWEKLRTTATIQYIDL